MNAIDLYTKFYAELRSRNSFVNKILSVPRHIIKYAANRHLPIILSRKKQDVKTDKRIIVSFTSFPARIDNVWQVVENMRHQSVQPWKIILWLSAEQFPNNDSVPKSLSERVGEDFEIRIVPGDIRSHKKHFYVFQEFPDHLVILIDDDIYYPSTMIEELLIAHTKHPEAIICRYGFVMQFDETDKIMPYRKWTFWTGSYSDRSFFFGSGGGTLVQPRLLHSDVSNKKLFLSLTPLADDIWLNAMTYLARTPIVKIKSGIILNIDNKNNESLYTINLNGNKNDEQLNNVIAYYKNSLGIENLFKQRTS